jgi:hypothetical protein
MLADSSPFKRAAAIAGVIALAGCIKTHVITSTPLPIPPSHYDQAEAVLREFIGAPQTNIVYRIAYGNAAAAMPEEFMHRFEDLGASIESLHLDHYTRPHRPLIDVHSGRSVRLIVVTCEAAGARGSRWVLYHAQTGSSEKYSVQLTNVGGLWRVLDRTPTLFID